MKSMPFRLKLLALISLTFTTVDRLPPVAAKCQQWFTCGQFLYNISSDLYVRVKDDPDKCDGSSNSELSCEHNRTVLYLDLNSNKYYVTGQKVHDGITNFNSSIRILDPGIQKKNCSSFPLYSFRRYYRGNDDLIIFVSCKRAVKSPRYIDTAPCLSVGNRFSDPASSERLYSYVVFGKAATIVASDIEETCTIHRSIMSSFPSLDYKNNTGKIISFQDIHDALAEGYVFYFEFRNSFLQYGVIDTMFMILPRMTLLLGMFIGARPTIGFILFFAFLVYKWRRRHLSIYDTIEDFLKGRSSVVPIRYSYREIKKMTNNFKEKLGEGGFGSVYKGKLRSGQFVAIKILTKSKANGQDFINEVATLGRIHHVNVVRLVGFCATASKNALVYDYMSNGSLDKFIFAQEPRDIELDWSKIKEIATGVARGVEYLHQGCNMQILHFDIKPHNILLDENFVPKVSDFGLAKLRPVKNNVITMTAVRGTLGYMAPELFYKRVGDVSYKVDVYSFGMLLMEMAGRRRNVNAKAEHSSQIYFPSWIYNHFEQGNDLEFTTHITEEDKEIARKMILIALWCIQMTSNDRPSMKEVLEMLQGDSKNLQLPPKPHFYPPDTPVSAEENSYFSSIEDEFAQNLSRYVSLEIQEL